MAFYFVECIAFLINAHDDGSACNDIQIIFSRLADTKKGYTQTNDNLYWKRINNICIMMKLSWICIYIEFVQIYTFHVHKTLSAAL